MPAISASAPGKVILFGEHAVVYGQPAIAVPVSEVRAKATLEPDIQAPKGQIRIQAPDIKLNAMLDELSPDNPLAAAVSLVLETLGLAAVPAFSLKVTSTIPLAGGLGSGAAVSVAIIRTVSAFLGRSLSNEQVSQLAFEVERLHHGTPSGIDNTVVTFTKPVFFVMHQPIEIFPISRPFTLVIADTGVPSPTKITVGDVRRAWQSEPWRSESIFRAIGDIAMQARVLLETGDVEALGSLMDQNQVLLQDLDVSSPELDALTVAARSAGALGAKLSGGGHGGNIIALVHPIDVENVVRELVKVGATNTITTEVTGELGGEK